MTDLKPSTTMWRIADLERRVKALENAIAVVILHANELARDIKAASSG